MYSSTNQYVHICMCTYLPRATKHIHKHDPNIIISMYVSLCLHMCMYGICMVFACACVYSIRVCLHMFMYVFMYSYMQYIGMYAHVYVWIVYVCVCLFAHN